MAQRQTRKSERHRDIMSEISNNCVRNDNKNETYDSDEGSLLFDMWDSSGSENEENPVIEDQGKTKECRQVKSATKTPNKIKLMQGHKNDRSEFVKKCVKTYCEKCKKSRPIKFRDPSCPTCKTRLTYRCGKCQRSYKHQKALVFHIKGKHSVKLVRDAIHKCSKCGKVFQYLSYQKRHENGCRVDTKISCDYCLYKAGYRSTMTYHVKTKHADKLVVRCSKCGMRYTNRKSLLRHTARYCKNRKLV